MKSFRVVATSNLVAAQQFAAFRANSICVWLHIAGNPVVEEGQDFKVSNCSAYRVMHDFIIILFTGLKALILRLRFRYRPICKRYSRTDYPNQRLGSRLNRTTRLARIDCWSARISYPHIAISATTLKKKCTDCVLNRRALRRHTTAAVREFRKRPPPERQANVDTGAGSVLLSICGISRKTITVLTRNRSPFSSKTISVFIENDHCFHGNPINKSAVVKTVIGM